jgi:hypothetical protein
VGQGEERVDANAPRVDWHVHANSRRQVDEKITAVHANGGGPEEGWNRNSIDKARKIGKGDLCTRLTDHPLK